MEATRCLRLETGNIETCCRCSGSIKGASAGGEAVLCTRDRTYALKHVQTTNTVLLMPSDAGVRSSRHCLSDPTAHTDIECINHQLLAEHTSQHVTAAACPLSTALYRAWSSVRNCRRKLR